jgi:hypothetical protein
MTNKTNMYKQQRQKLGNMYQLDNNDLIGASLTGMMQQECILSRVFMTIDGVLIGNWIY